MPNSNLTALAQAQDQMDRLKRMMARTHAVSSRTGDELATRWARNISYYLFVVCKKFSPTADMFGIGGNSIAVSHDYKIADFKNNIRVSPSDFSDKGKKRSQFSRVKDIMRQRGHHRMYIASGWLAVKKIVSKSGTRLQTQELKNGAVVVDVSQSGLFGKIRVRIINTSTFAKPFHDKHNIVNEALEMERQDLAQYISRKTHEDVQEILRTT